MPEQERPEPLPSPVDVAPEPDPLLHRVLVGKFRLDRLLGVGAMGRVYQAEHLALSQQIAVKVLHRHLAGDESLARRFHREAKSAFRLNHPNSISIMDFGQDADGTLYIAMELLEGRSLLEVIDEEGPLPLERTLRILGQVCSALDEAHHQGIVHRDLKPENVMVTDRRGESDFVKVCDFGIAKVRDQRDQSAITMAGMVCGTPEYMSPEQARGEELDGRSDLYSLGVMLFQMITKRLPFTAETALGCVTKHLTEIPPSPRDLRPDLDVPPILSAFVLRCLSKDREARPPTAAAFRDELADIAARVARGEREEGAPSLAAVAPEVTAITPRQRGRRAGPAAIALVALLVAGGGVIAWRVASRGEKNAKSSPPSQPLAKGSQDASAPGPGLADAGVRPRPTAAADAGAPAAKDAGRATAPVEGPRRRHRRRPPGVMRERPREPPAERPRERPAAEGFQARWDEAMAAFSGGRYGAALAKFHAALQARPGHAATQKYIAQCHLRLGRPCDALTWFRRYQRQRPGDFFVKQHVQTLSQKCGK